MYEVYIQYGTLDIVIFGLYKNIELRIHPNFVILRYNRPKYQIFDVQNIVFSRCIKTSLFFDISQHRTSDVSKYRYFLYIKISSFQYIEVSNFRYIELPIYRTIARVSLLFVYMWHPRVFHADTQRKLSTYG